MKSYIRILFISLIGIALSIAIIFFFIRKSELQSADETADFWEIYSQEELSEYDFLLYRVDCANSASKEKWGLFQSVADQEFGKDESTGKNWGYKAVDYMVAVKDKYGTGINEYKWEIAESIEYDNESTGFYYDFELPNGEYEISIGFYNPFSARTVTVQAEESDIVCNEKILKYELAEEVAYVDVEDGMLNLKVYNPTRNKDAMKNPILSFIEVRAVPKFSREMLISFMENIKGSYENKGRYTNKTYSAFLDSYNAAEKMLAEHIDKEGKNSDFRRAYLNLKSRYGELEDIEMYSSFKVAAEWKDTEGNLIQAHGGQVQKFTYIDKDTLKEVTKWWWVGEDKRNGAHGGVCAYSSDDLYNWKYEGVVMRNVKSREELDTDAYFKDLYAGYTDEQLDNVFTCLNASTAIIERPKLIYNPTTDMYVLWFHADGPTESSNSSYAAASAGVAVSNTPYGPFRFIDRYRLNRCPDDQEDMYPQSKGMARDMNLYVDDDGTAYIIYSSEENLTLYISKLNDEYTYLATNPDEAVYGTDFIRLYPGAQREAPAVFKKDGYYYLISSGCTGWAPNQARYYKASSMLGEWANEGDPCIGDTKKTTFDSQSTAVFVADDGTYVFMADRWNSEDLANSRYIWLPIKFSDDGEISIEYTEEWKLK